MAEDEKRCTLPKSARCCMMEYAGDEACTHCGWQPEERARRKALPLTEDENGVRRKHVGKIKVFQRELHRMNHAKKFYCSQTCAEKQVAQDREGVPFEKKNFPTKTRIRIMTRIPVFQKLQPKVGAVYDALKFEARYGGHGGYVIESGGKKINVRLDEAVEI